MEAEVDYDENHDPTSITVRDDWGEKKGRARMVGGTACVMKVYPSEGYSHVNGEDCVDVMEYVNQLPFVQASKFGDAE